MPLYEYLCSECGRLSEISHRISEPNARDCPVCGKPALTKQMSAAAFRLKGAGWYETDFKSEGKRNLAGDSADAAPASSAAASDAKPEAVAESKTQAKPEPKPASKPEAAPAPKPASPAPAA